MRFVCLLLLLIPEWLKADPCTNAYPEQPQCFNDRTCDWDTECYQIPQNCNARNSLSACFRDGECIWDAEQSVCLPRAHSPFSRVCLNFTSDPLQCVNDTRCEFDTYMKLCSERRTGLCTTLQGDPAICSTSAGCAWRHGECVTWTMDHSSTGPLDYGFPYVSQFLCRTSALQPFDPLYQQSASECTRKPGCAHQSSTNSLFSCDLNLPSKAHLPETPHRSNNSIQDAGITTAVIILMSLLFVGFVMVCVCERPGRAPKGK